MKFLCSFPFLTGLLLFMFTHFNFTITYLVDFFTDINFLIIETLCIVIIIL